MISIKGALAPIIFLIMSGCTNHPLTNEVIGYSSSQLVHKLRCELQASIWSYLDENNLNNAQHVWLAAKRAMEQRSEFKKDNKKFFQTIDGPLATIERGIASFRERADTLDNKLDEVESKLTIAKVEQQAASTEMETAAWQRKVLKLTRRRVALKTNKEHLLVEARKFAKKQKATYMKLSRLLKRKYPSHYTEGVRVYKLEEEADEQRRTATSVRNQSTKKLRRLFDMNFNVVAMELKFDIKESNTANTTGGLGWPLSIGSISLTWDAKKEKERQAVRIIEIVSTFEELSDQEQLNCDGANYDGNLAHLYPLVGKVGLDEFVQQFFDVWSSNGTIEAHGTNDAFVDTLTFTTTVSAGLHPKVELTKIIPTVTKAGLDLDTSRTDVHAVTTVVKPYVHEIKAPPPPSPPNRTIVSFDGGDDGSGNVLGSTD